jgi:cytochrome c biogenesis protein CcdA
MAQKVVGFIVGILMIFVANTLFVALVPSVATVERQYVNTTAGWGAKLRGQATNVGGLAPTTVYIGGTP